jgi:hypothetical protein
MNKENLIEINDEILNSISRELEKKYQSGIISVTELEEQTNKIEYIRKDERAKRNLSRAFNKDLQEYGKGLNKYNESFAEDFLKKIFSEKDNFIK